MTTADGQRPKSADLTPGTRLRWTGTHVFGRSPYAILERRKSPDDHPPYLTRPFHDGWWCEGGGGLADFVIDDPESKWEVVQ